MKYQKGDIVIIGFPFSDLSGTKKRPALIISNSRVNDTGDYLLVQITSKIKNDHLSLPVDKNSFINGKELPLRSFIRLHKIFLLNEDLIISKYTGVTNDFINKVIKGIITLIK